MSKFKLTFSSRSQPEETVLAKDWKSAAQEWLKNHSVGRYHVRYANNVANVSAKRIGVKFSITVTPTLGTN